MVELCQFTKIGMAMDLLAQSEFHRRFATGLYVQIEILPPVKLGQIWFLLDEDGRARALVSWAMLDQKALDDIVATGRSVNAHEWNCGHIVFVNDFIAPEVPALRIVRMLKDEKVFGDAYTMTSFRRHMDASVRRVNRWTNRDVLRNGTPKDD